MMVGWRRQESVVVCVGIPGGEGGRKDDDEIKKEGRSGVINDL
jgi:hypothetical protein